MFHELLLAVLCVSPLVTAGTAGRAEVYSSCSEPNTVALTFHDGPYDFSKDLVDIFNEREAKATFFLNGDNWRCIYDDDMIEAVRYAYDSGHLIASHTWNHHNLSDETAAEVNDQMEKLDVALERIIGVTAAWMRPPNGSYNDVVLEVAGKRGQNVVLWDFNSRDTSGITTEEIQDAYVDLADQHPCNALTLNVETRESTVYDVIPFAIDLFKSKGYRLVTVSECLGGLPDYQKVIPRSEKDDSWVC